MSFNFGDKFIEIFDKLKSIMTDLKKDSTKVFEKVIQGYKTPADEFPCCLILPTPSPIEPATVKKDANRFNFVIDAVTQDEDTLQGMRDAIEKAGLAVDALKANRTLDQIIEQVLIGRFVCDWREFPAFTRHHVAVFITCEVYG